MGLYLPSGYLDFRGLRDRGYPFNLIIGGRGTGKTYGALQTSIEDGKQWMLMRRTQAQADIINHPQFSPVQPIIRDSGGQICMVPVVRGISAAWRYQMDGDKRELLGGPLGYTCALSTIGKVRGFDASALDLIIYDEFIPEKSERPLRHEADALFNAYETLNRNRELQGGRPLQLFCLSNSNDLAAPVLVALDLVKRLERMAEKGTELWTDDRRGILLCLLRGSPISAAKRGTALYKLTAGSDFAEMSLDNTFSYEDRGRIVSRPLGEYRPLVRVGDVTVYQHKARPEYYVSRHHAGGCPEYAAGDTELLRFRRSYPGLWAAHLADRVEYEDYTAQVKFLEYCG